MSNEKRLSEELLDGYTAPDRFATEAEITAFGERMRQVARQAAVLRAHTIAAEHLANMSLVRVQ